MFENCGNHTTYKSHTLKFLRYKDSKLERMKIYFKIVCLFAWKSDTMFGIHNEHEHGTYINLSGHYNIRFKAGVAKIYKWKSNKSESNFGMQIIKTIS